MDAGKLIRFCGLVVELHMHTNVYAEYGRGCSLSETCQVAMVNATRELDSGSNDYTSLVFHLFHYSINKIYIQLVITCQQLH